MASHREIIQFIKDQKISSAEDLFCAGERLSAEGDPRILTYCMGSGGGMKKGLNAIVEKARADERTRLESCEKHEVEGDPEAGTSLCILKRRAQEPRQPQAKSGPRQVQKKVSSGISSIAHSQNDVREMEVRNFKNQKRVMVKDIVLFDSYERRAEIVFEPKNGIWRLRDYYELLVECRADEVLAGICPSHSVEGGFTIPRSEPGWRQMLLTKVTQVRKPFADLTQDERTEAAAELRFGLGCGSLRWAPLAGGPHSASPDDWVDLMPDDPLFEADRLKSLFSEERLVRLWAHRHVEDRQLQAFSRTLEACGHKIHQTTGFRISKTSTIDSLFCVTGSRDLTSRHKSGANRRLPFALCAAQLDCDGEASQIVHHRTSVDGRPSALRNGSCGEAKLRALLPSTSLAIEDHPETSLAIEDHPETSLAIEDWPDKSPVALPCQADSAVDDHAVDLDTPPKTKKLRASSMKAEQKNVRRRPAAAELPLERTSW